MRWRNHDAIERLVTGVRRANGAWRVMCGLSTFALARAHGVCSRSLARTCDARAVCAPSRRGAQPCASSHAWRYLKRKTTVHDQGRVGQENTRNKTIQKKRIPVTRHASHAHVTLSERARGLLVVRRDDEKTYLFFCRRRTLARQGVPAL